MKKISALIIDDSEIDRYILSRQLGEIGVEDVFEKDDGASALDFFENYEKNRHHYPDEFPPAVIFLDINMPIVGGFEFLEKFKKLRSDHHLDGCVIMMYSSSERSEDKVKAFEYEFVTDFLVKGEMTLDELKAKIADIQSS